MKINYRPDIDGLRAVAVLSVLFFHTEIPGFSGGFVGVDIFFVISGYLITLILLKDIEEDKFSIVRFYEKRIRRIYPALFAVIFFILIAGFFFMAQDAFDALGESITAATLFWSNILFQKQSGYFEAPSFQKPLLHTWSLAIEEQYYVIFPLLLSQLHKFKKQQAFNIILLLWIISFGSSIYYIHDYQRATFYFLQFRAWELLTGTLLAFHVFPSLKSERFRDAASLTGLILVLGSVWFYSENTLFPGLSAFVPVLGAGLIIHSGINIGQKESGIGNRILSFKPLVVIGLISYSLYLWHWPILAFEKYLIFWRYGLPDAITIIAISLALAFLSWKYIEQPFRSGNALLQQRGPLFAVALTIMFVSAASGRVIHLQQGMPWRNNPDATISMKTDPAWIEHEARDKWIDGMKDGNQPPVIGFSRSTPSFALWGDSHAVALASGLEKKAMAYHVSGYNISRTGVRPLLGMDRIRGEHDEVGHNNAVINFLRHHPEVKTVIIAAEWSDIPSTSYRDIYDQFHQGESQEKLLRTGLSRSVDTLRSMGKDVIVVMDVPRLKKDPNSLLFISKRLNIPVSVISSNKEDYFELNKIPFKAIHDISENRNITVLHPEKMLFDSSGKALPMHSGNFLYVDDNHLSAYGSAYVSVIFNPLFTQKVANKKNDFKFNE
jgi:peptidoglycan/LPS O-acetylase OafA/YrhL